jgi:low affinity Fe/Cu permease
LGTPWAFLVALIIIIAWIFTGPIFNFSDTWQLVINTGTTIITFLMVFLIQNTQNRDAKAIHLKLDELIRGMRGARNGLVDLEDLTDEELDLLQEEFRHIREKHGKLHDQLIEQVEDIAEQKVEEEAERTVTEKVEKQVTEKVGNKGKQAKDERKNSKK